MEEGAMTSFRSEDADDSGHLIVSLKMSTESVESLNRLAQALGSPLEDVIAKSFLLYKAAAEANLQGKAVGIAPSADVLETEFVGF
jgi:hypothetical protein